MVREYSPKAIELAVNTIKTLSIDGVEKANSGHPGTPMGLALDGPANRLVLD